MRLIDADALFQQVSKNLGTSAMYLPIDLQEEIMKAHTIDAKPVVHGRWIGIEYDGYADGPPVFCVWECSECGEEHNGDDNTLTKYCPNCGTKMDKGV